MIELPDIQQLKDNDRTKYMALELERLLDMRVETELMIGSRDEKYGRRGIGAHWKTGRSYA